DDHVGAFPAGVLPADHPRGLARPFSLPVGDARGPVVALDALLVGPGAALGMMADKYGLTSREPLGDPVSRSPPRLGFGRVPLRLGRQPVVARVEPVG